MNGFFYVAIGVVVGAGTVAGLWIRDVEKQWEPPEDMAVEAWEAATGKSAREMGETAARVALVWWNAWRMALMRPRE